MAIRKYNLENVNLKLTSLVRDKKLSYFPNYISE